MPSTLPSDLKTNEMLTVYRGQTVNFQASFVLAGRKVIPLDASMYPSFSIHDPTGAAIITGVGTDMGNGLWQATWTIPPAAKTGDCKIVWTMVSNTQRTSQATQRFTLKEQNNAQDIVMDPSEFIFWPSVGDQVSILTDGPKVNMQLAIMATNTNLTLATYNETTTLIDGITPDIKTEQIGTQVLYFANLNGYAPGEWFLIWTYQDSAGGPRKRVIKHLYVPWTMFWELHPALADLLDRVQKNANATPFGYYEEDYYRAMKMGFMTLNRFKPLTQWNMSDPTFPRSMDHYLLEASAFWAMKAREIGAGELQFNYSGQEVTLDVDRSSIYATQAQAFADDINNQFKLDKVNWYRHTYTPVRLGLRLGLGVSAVLGGGDLLGGVTSPYLRGFSRARRKGSW